MATLTRFQKEQALRAAGVQVRTYPTAANTDTDRATQNASDLALLQAGSVWEQEIDRLHLELDATQAEDGQPSSESVQAFSNMCAGGGTTSALKSLNDGVPHRYTAVYRLTGDQMQNVELVDKEGHARPEFLAAVPLSSSFCQYVLRDGVFVTEDSGQDERLDGHPYKGVMAAYHGVPIINEAGQILGSLCHFDIVTRTLSDEEFQRLRALARALPAFIT